MMILLSLKSNCFMMYITRRLNWSNEA